MSISDTTSQVELDALVEQIQDLMTPDQIKAIEALDLTNQSMLEVLQTIGANSGEVIPQPLHLMHQRKARLSQLEDQVECQEVVTA